MKWVTTTTVKLLDELDAKALAAASLGPPVPVGGGVHAPPEQCVTLRYADARKHPTREEWCYPVDEFSEKVAEAYAAEKKVTLTADVALPKEWRDAEEARAETLDKARKK